MADKTVATEVAEADFERFLELMDLAYKCDTSRMDAEDSKAFERHKFIVVTAIERGSLVIDEKGQPVFQPTAGGDPITFYEPDGAVFMAADAVKTGRDVEKTNLVMAAMTKTSAKLFANMKARDYKVCQSIFIIFFS